VNLEGVMAWNYLEEMLTLVFDSYFQYQINGADQLAEALSLIKDLPTEKRVIQAAERKALAPMRDTVERLSPIDKGDLKDSWVITPRITKSQKDEIGNDAVGMYVGSIDQSAHLVEFGVKAHKVEVQKKKTLWGFGRSLGTEADIPEIPPNPIMTIAFEQNKGRSFDLLGKEIWKALEKLANRLSKQAGKGKLSASGKRALGIK